MTKVLHIGGKLHGGGAETVFRNTLLLLKSCSPSTDLEHLLACSEDGTAYGLKTHLLFSSPGSAMNEHITSIYSFKNRRLLSKFLEHEKPNIVHVQNFGLLSGSIFHALSLYKKKNKSVKIIHTSHSFNWVCSHHAGFDYRKDRPCLDCAKSKRFTKIFWRGCSRGGWVHSWGKGLAALVSDHFLKKHLVDVCLTPSDFSRFPIELRFPDQKVLTVRNPLQGNFLSQQVGEQKKEDVIVYFGRMSAEKNLSLLLKAFSVVNANIKDARLMMIGDGTDKNNLMNEARSIGLNNVEFLGFMPPEKLKSCLSLAKASVLPSKFYETAGLTIPESILMNVVPIVTAHGGLLETIELLNCGETFENGNEHELAEKICYALVHFYEYQEKLNIGKAKIIEILSEDKYVRSLLNIYASASTDQTHDFLMHI